MDVHVDVDDATDSVPRRLHRMSEYDEGLFGFEKLDAYQRAVEFLAVAVRVIEGLTAGQHPIADQLRRAALSVPVNVAEGVGRTSAADRRRHYAIARGSAMECAAILNAWLRSSTLQNPGIRRRQPPQTGQGAPDQGGQHADANV